MLLTKKDHGENSTISIACSPDGTLVATSSLDGTVFIRDSDSLEIIAQLASNSITKHGLSFSPDDTKLVAGSADGALALFDTQTGRKLVDLPAHRKRIASVQYSPDGSIIATCSTDNTVHLIDSETFELLAVLDSHSDAVNAIAFSTDGKLLASASSDQSIIVWDVATASEIRKFTGHRDRVNAVEFYGVNQIISAGEDGAVILWDMKYDDPVAVLIGHVGGVQGIDVDLEEGLIASAGFDGTIKLWTIKAGVNTPYFGLHNPMTTAVFHSNSSRVAYTTPGGELKVDDWRSNETLHAWNLSDERIIQISWNPDGSSVALYTYDAVGKSGNVHLFDFSLGAVRWTLHDSAYPVFSPDGSRLAIRLRGRITTLNPKTSEVLTTLDTDIVVRNICFSPDGTKLILGGHNNDTEVWDYTTGQRIAVLEGHTQPINDVVVSSKYNRVYTASADRTIRLWDLSTGEYIGMYAGHDSSVERLAINPKENRLASASSDGAVRIWSMETGDQLMTIAANGTPKSLEFSHDGSILHWVGSELHKDGSHESYWWYGANNR